MSKTYLVCYNFDGSEWNLELKADNWQDAEARVRRLAYARVEGELVAKVPGAFGIFAAAAVFVRNFFRRLI